MCSSTGGSPRLQSRHAHSLITPDGLIDFHGSYDEYLVSHPLPERERRGNW